MNKNGCIPILIIFAVIGFFILISLPYGEMSQAARNAQWQAQNSPQFQQQTQQATWKLTDGACYVGGFIFVLFALFAGAKMFIPSGGNINTISGAIVALNNARSVSEIERELRRQYSNEEIQLPGIDIRLESHRRFLDQMRAERQPGERISEQYKRWRREGRERPVDGNDFRRTGQSQPSELGAEEIIDAINEHFGRRGVSARWSPNSFGTHDIHLTRRGNKGRRDILDVRYTRGGVHLITTDEDHKRDVEVFYGDAGQAANLIQTWCNGGGGFAPKSSDADEDVDRGDWHW